MPRLSTQAPSSKNLARMAERVRNDLDNTGFSVVTGLVPTDLCEEVVMAVSERVKEQAMPKIMGSV